MTEFKKSDTSDNSFTCSGVISAGSKCIISLRSSLTLLSFSVMNFLSNFKLSFSQFGAASMILMYWPNDRSSIDVIGLAPSSFFIMSFISSTVNFPFSIVRTCLSICSIKRNLSVSVSS